MKIENLAEEIAALRAEVAELRSWQARAERVNPQLGSVRADDKRAERYTRAKAITSIKEWRAATPRVRAAFLEIASVDALIDMARAAEYEDLRAMLDALDHRRAASIHFALADAPELVRVTSRRAVDWSNGVRVDQVQAKALEAVGIRITRFDGRCTMAGWGSPKGGVHVFTQAAWTARVAADSKLAGYVEAGEVEVESMSGTAAREHALRAYIDWWADQPSTNVEGPKLPPLPGAPVASAFYTSDVHADSADAQRYA